VAEPAKFTTQVVEQAEKLIGLSFTEAKRDSMLEGLSDQLKNYEHMRSVALPNSVPPALVFDPIPVGFYPSRSHKEFRMSDYSSTAMPGSVEDLAFATVGELAQLLKSRKVTSVELTKMYIARLKKYDPKLHCVVTLTEDIALRQARHADEEIASGKYRGPLNGIPYGVKDLLAAKGAPTTWGSVPFKAQTIDEDATVVRRLNEAGAVMLAKLSMGELAWGDVWFGGKTRNPWNIERGSSGSSAGSASATSAGLVAFSIGTETWGSIVSPSTECGTTGLRPTYGRVSRTGAMALSWSMDKIGPICRNAEDCAIVFNAICGPDGKDATLEDASFNYTPDVQLSSLRIGYLKSDFDSVKENKEFNEAAFATLRGMGARLIPVSLPHYPVSDSDHTERRGGSGVHDLTRAAGRPIVRQIKMHGRTFSRLKIYPGGGIYTGKPHTV
jgi:Asp-tRNA(Asn)/Glu-tRNA(Gln) amidotransferase A subunit family amidase